MLFFHKYLFLCNFCQILLNIQLDFIFWWGLIDFQLFIIVVLTHLAIELLLFWLCIWSILWTEPYLLGRAPACILLSFFCKHWVQSFNIEDKVYLFLLLFWFNFPLNFVNFIDEIPFQFFRDFCWLHLGCHLIKVVELLIRTICLRLEYILQHVVLLVSRLNEVFHFIFQLIIHNFCLFVQVFWLFFDHGNSQPFFGILLLYDGTKLLQESLLQIDGEFATVRWF